MRMIVGLGNIGKQYEHTRHNAGFDVIDIIAKEKNVSFKEETKRHALIGFYHGKNGKTMLVKPTTFMNLSGDAVVSIMDYYDITMDDLLIIHDDMDLPVGKIRIRTSGSSAGQKGMGDIILKLANQNINRIRVGIGKHNKIDTIDYVLGKIHGEELEIYQQSLSKAAKAALDYGDGCTMAYIMNHYNG